MIWSLEKNGKTSKRATTWSTGANSNLAFNYAKLPRIERKNRKLWKKRRSEQVTNLRPTSVWRLCATAISTRTGFQNGEKPVNKVSISFDISSKWMSECHRFFWKDQRPLSFYAIVDMSVRLCSSILPWYIHPFVLRRSVFYLCQSVSFFSPAC